MNTLLVRQLKQATRPDGSVDVELLLRAIGQTYDQHAEERRGVVRAMQIMAEEAKVLAHDSLKLSVEEARDAALRDSEARYRTLVEHAPEAIVVVDVDRAVLVDVNENAVLFFKRSREELLALPPKALSAPTQSDGALARLAQRDYLRRALTGETPVYEWDFTDALGNVIPCEVRLVRLPSSSARLVRGSITDISERKHRELLGRGERRVFERLAANLDLPATLATIVEMAESVCSGALCAIRLADDRRKKLQLIVAPSLPESYVRVAQQVSAGMSNGSCAAALYFSRQIVVGNIAEDPFWSSVRNVASEAGLGACWSTLIYASTGKVLGTIALYFRQQRLPTRDDFDLMSRLAQLAAIAIERRRSEVALRDSERRYRRLFDNVVEGVYMASSDGRFVSVNPALVRMLGAGSEAEVRSLSLDALYVDPLQRLEFISSLSHNSEVCNAEFRMRRVDGTTIVVVENARAVRDENARLVGFEGSITDVTARKQAEQQLRAEKDRALVTLQSIADGVITTDASGKVEYLNPVAEQLTGWGSAEICGRHVGELLRIVNETTGAGVENPVILCLREQRVVAGQGSATLINRIGREIAIEETAAPIRDHAGGVIGVVMVFHDVSKERRLRRALTYQAHHDALTGLINRREFESKLNEALARVQRGISQYVLMYLDLDQFKIVNDTCGHQAGDRLLKQVTGLLQTRLRATDVIARLGGDEFGILLESCNERQAHLIAENLRKAIHEHRFEWNGTALYVGASIGFVEIDGTSDSVVNAMSAADVACYAAKQSGRNRVQAYQSDHVQPHHREMQWVSRISRACDENRLELYCQPIVPISSAAGSATATEYVADHFELLLRMRDEDGRLVPPGEFVPAAERYNIMPKIDRWVLRQALLSLATWQLAEQQPFMLSINLSGTSLNDDGFLEFITGELQQFSLRPRSLCFEITETAAISNLAKVVHLMRELKGRGCLFSLDDFGSGLSSFVYLKNLPVDYLKIDGQFIQQVNADRIDRSMVSAIHQVGRAMGIKTIAEQVESHGVLHALNELGVDFAQGYLIAEPRPLEAMMSGSEFKSGLKSGRTAFA